MPEFQIDVSEIENHQTLKNIVELESIFLRARSVIRQGGAVSLIRKTLDGTTNKFDELSTDEELENYKQNVFKYL